MELHIKNMVCDRCIMVVNDELVELGLNPVSIALGVAIIGQQSLQDEIRTALSDRLKINGFELLDSAKSQLVEKMKVFIINIIHYGDIINLKSNWSDLLAGELNYDYNHLSTLFSTVEGISVEQYIIRQKIEKAKELLFYDEKNLSEISFFLGYSSVQHLSAQFRKITGHTPSQYKKEREFLKSRRSLDSIS